MNDHQCPTCAGSGKIEGIDVSKMLFFGTWPGTGAGHFLYDQSGLDIYDRSIPFDGPACCPKRGAESHNPQDQPQGYVRVTWHEVKGITWTVVSAWDKTEDKRNGSHACFAAPGRTTGEEALKASAIAFPLKWAQLEKAGGVKIEETG